MENLEQLYLLYRGAVYRYLLSLCRDEHQAEELLAMPDLKALGLEKQKKLLSEKVDINGYYMAEMDRLVRAGRKG